MGEQDVLERIAAWEAAGLINAATAARLRAAEAAASAGAGWSSGAAAAPGRGLAEAFGPPVSIAEVFGYVGAGFVLIASYVFVGTLNLGTIGWTVDLGATAVVLTALAGWLLGGSDRGRRAAGVALFVAAANAGFAALNLIGPVTVENEGLQFAALGAGILLTGAIYVRAHPALTTHAAFLLGAGVLTFGIDQTLDRRLYQPVDVFGTFVPPTTTEILMRVLAAFVVWLVAAIAVGWLAALWTRSATPEGARRLALTRFVAGLLAVIGATIAVSRGRDGLGGPGAILQPWMGELAIGLVGLALFALAFRRETTAFIYPAALALIIALTEFNGDYIANTTGIAGALLVEGLVLLGAGLATERVRRRLTARHGSPPPGDASVPSDASAAGGLSATG